MIILDTTTKSLQIKLAAAVTTNQLPFSASFVDSTGTAITPGEQDGASNNTTAVTVVSSPSSSTERLLKSFIIQNADTASAKVTVTYNNNSTLRNVFIATLAVGDQLVYEDGQGWACLDTNGNLKTSASGGGGGAVSSVSNSDGTLTVSPTTGNVIASLGNFAANTVLANATASSAQPTGISLSSSQLMGRGATGNVSAITLGTNLSMSGTTLNATAGGGGVSSVSNSDGTLTISPTTGAVVASLGSFAANTVLANATASSAQPTGISLSASQLFGRGSSGNLTAITIGTNLSMSGSTLNASGGGGGSSGIVAQCQFQYTSSTVCTLMPLNGNQVTFPGGAVCTIGSSGISSTITSAYINGTSGQTLSASTLYYSYLWNNGSSYVIDWSTTAYTVDSSTGITIKSGDNTRVLVGMAYTDSTPHFNNADGLRTVLSWFNRQRISSKTAFTTNRTTTSTSFTEVNSEIRNTVLVWAGQNVDYSITGSAAINGATDGVSTAIGFNTTSSAEPGTSFAFQTTINEFSPINISGSKTGLSEGSNYATLLGGVANQTGTWASSDSIGSQTAACRLNLWTWG